MAKRSREDLLGIEPAAAPRGVGRPVEDHRQQLVLAQAEHVRLKTAKLRGELVPAADVERQWMARIVDTRQRLLAVASRFAARHGLSKAVRTDLDAEIRAALSALAARGGVSDGGGPSEP